MFVKIEDLQVGDEILVPSLMEFKRLRVKRLPKLNKQGYYSGMAMDIWNDNINGTYVQYNSKEEGYNDTFRFCFDRQMWLISRKI